MKLKAILLSLGVVVLAQTAKTQTLDWAKQLGGTSREIGNSIGIDSSGNVYTTGRFEGIADFDPGADATELTSFGGIDVYISKLDAAGNYVWAKQMGGTGDDAGISMAIDPSGNVYTTGSFQGTADFDPGTDMANLTSAGSNDIFISKLDADGNYVWAKKMGGTGNDIGHSIAIDASGNVYTTGRFEGTVDFDPGPGTTNLTSEGGTDVFISKLDAEGNFVWAKQLGGTNNAEGRSIAVDASGNVYTTGFFAETADFNPGAIVFNLTSAGSNDIFVSKLNASGNFVWAKQFGGTGNNIGNAITVDASGNVYTTGRFGSTADFDPGAGTANLTSAGGLDVFVSKLDASGNYVWAKQLGGAGSNVANSIAADTAGNVYTTGYFQVTADFDPGPDTANLTSVGGSDVFISKLDASGDYVWAKQLGGTSGDIGNAIILNAAGNIFTTGRFEGTANFDPEEGTANLTSAGDFDAFVHKMLQCTLATGTDTRTECNSFTWIDGNTYFASNDTATFNIAGGAASGCDSLVTLDLTIINSATGTDTRTECNSFTWIDGNTYFASNDTATFNIPGGAVNGCDSLVTLDLTIINSATGTDTRTECNSFTWIDGNTYFASNDTATFNIPGGAVNGCDSLVTLDLTIINSATGTDVQTVCNAFTWIDGNTYTSDNDTATFNIAGGAANGCDSLVTLNLIITNVSDLTTITSGTTIMANNASADYQWLDCDNGHAAIEGETGQSFTATANGNYAVQLTENGCVDTSDCVNITSVGIIENAFNSQISVFPNPTSGALTLNFENEIGNVQLIIRNAVGQEVMRKNYISAQHIGFTLEGSAGVYFIEVLHEGKKAVLRIVKE